VYLTPIISRARIVYTSAFGEGVLRTINCKQDYVFMPVIAEDIIDVHEVQMIDSVIQRRPLIIIADNVINRLLLSKSVVPKYSI
jgi:hypothetical protein